MRWNTLPLWNIIQLQNTYVLKVDETIEDTLVTDSPGDSSVSLEVHHTTNGKLVGYQLSYQDNPRLIIKRWYLGMFYRIDPKDDQTITILYHDQQTRLLSFGKDAKDYLWVARWHPDPFRSNDDSS